jgi:lysyl-tRNA synthetase class 1
MKYKQWPFQEAVKIINRAKGTGKDRVLLETGYGPSGLPHIGTFGEVARTSFVVSALDILAPDLPKTLLAFSDDLDGLRSVPENVPNREMLAEHLGKPLTAVPDPFERFESFAAHNNYKLKEFLDSFGFEYQFASSTETYRSGAFNEGLALIMRNHQRIIDIFTATISEEKRRHWSPFFPLCENCGKNTTTRILEHDAERNEVAYECRESPNAAIAPCGHAGRTSIFDGRVKVGWKIDWALRWYALGVDYEMHGKDLMDSVTVSEQVIKVIGGRSPITYKYELFLDEEGRKISKKLGNGMSLEEWLSYAPTDALLYFMYVNPNRPKRMAVSLLPKAVDDYLTVLRSYTGQTDHAVRLMKHKEIENGAFEPLVSGLDFGLIINLVRALNMNDPDVVLDYLLRYDPKVTENEPFFRILAAKAIAYCAAVGVEALSPDAIDHDLDRYLPELIQGLIDMQSAGDADPDTVQTLCFAIAREHELPMKNWFTHLYETLLGTTSGPKIGSFISLYGIDATVEKLEMYLAATNGGQPPAERI